MKNRSEIFHLLLHLGSAASPDGWPSEACPNCLSIIQDAFAVSAETFARTAEVLL